LRATSIKQNLMASLPNTHAALIMAKPITMLPARFSPARDGPMGRQPARDHKLTGFHAPREHHDGNRSTGKHDHASYAEERGHAASATAATSATALLKALGDSLRGATASGAIGRG
jgi:hypothetical protein